MRRSEPARASLLLVVLWLLAPRPAAAQVLSGQVTNRLGQPIAQVDLDFTISATGAPYSTSGDSTNSSGFYSVAVPPQVYDVEFTPPPGSLYAPTVLTNVNLTTSQVRNVVLDDAALLSGTVLRGDTGLPFQNVDVDVFDLSTGLKLFTPQDDTDLAGLFTVAVPAGIYEVVFDGRVEVYAPVRLAELSVTGPGTISLGTIVLPKGFRLKGEFRDDQIGDAVAGADLDVFPTGSDEKVFTTNDNTDSFGKFDLVVPPGNYKVRVSPPAGAPIPVRDFPGVNMTTGDADLGTVVLASGWSVQGVVRDPLGAAVRDVDLDVERTSTGEAVPVARDDTNATGNFIVVLPPGTVDITFDPVRAALLDPVMRPSVAVVSNLTLTPTVLPFHDEDADAVPDRTDVCPFRQDPAQADLDGDGVGDVCDVCPSAADPRQENNDQDGLGDVCDPDDDNDGLADAADPDLDGDTVANGADNCPNARNRNQRDRDANGLGDACDPGDGEVELVRPATRAGWIARRETGATGYRVYRHPLVWLTSVNYGTCFQNDLAVPAFTDTDIPGAAQGRGFVYLVTARTAAGEGSLGRRSDGGERPNLRVCP